MPIRIRCENCNAKLSVASRKAGMTIRCPGCKSEIQVPEPEPELVGAAAASAIPPATLGGWDDDDDDDDEDDEDFSLRSADTEFEEMDLTPMVDVTFLLLIFFMITASFTIQKTLQFPPPEKDEEGAAIDPKPKEEFKEDSVIVDIDENGGITVEGSLVSDRSALVAAIENARAGTSQIKDSILITRHYFCPHEASVRALAPVLRRDCCRNEMMQTPLTACCCHCFNFKPVFFPVGSSLAVGLVVNFNSLL